MTNGFFIFAVLGAELRNRRRIGFFRHWHALCVVFGNGVVQADLLSVELGDDRPQERNVVLLDLIDVAHVGHAQTKRLAVEFERHDGFEPLHELLFGRSGLDLVQTSLPFFAICLCGS